jgi:hypothetical protein
MYEIRCLCLCACRSSIEQTFLYNLDPNVVGSKLSLVGVLRAGQSLLYITKNIYFTLGGYELSIRAHWKGILNKVQIQIRQP